MLFLPLLIQVAKGKMLQPAYGDSVLGPTARLCSRVLFVEPPSSAAAEDALAKEIYNNLLSRYGAANARENALLVAQDGGELLGACGVNVERQPALYASGYVPVLANLVVDPGARRRGIGKRLVRQCEDVVRGWGYSKLFLKVEEANAPAQKLYSKLGYRSLQTDRAAEIPRGSSGVFGGSVQWVPTNLVVMEKHLAPFRVPFLDMF
jgi:GNAT superfamily N-acetyltransferase